MSDELGEFLDSSADRDAAQAAEQRVIRDLLMFEHTGDVYAVLASAVTGVVPWKTPARIPGANSRVAGVIQDRGRIVVLMAHPTGREASGRAEGNRIVICDTARGFVGLPASVTRAVGPVELKSEPEPFSVHDHKTGPFTYLDPTAYPETK